MDGRSRADEIGTTFAGRVAASLLRAVGLPELITGSYEDYEKLAVKLARDRDMLTSLKPSSSAIAIPRPCSTPNASRVSSRRSIPRCCGVSATGARPSPSLSKKGASFVMNDQLLQSAWRAHQAGNHAETARYARKFAGRSPAISPLFSSKAMPVAACRYEEAERLLGEAARVNPESPEAIYNRGCMLRISAGMPRPCSPSSAR